jgi:3-dehydroquinate synthase
MLTSFGAFRNHLPNQLFHEKQRNNLHAGAKIYSEMFDAGAKLFQFCYSLTPMDQTFTVIQRNIRLDFQHRTFFTHGAFESENPVLRDILKPVREGQRTKVLIYVDEGLLSIGDGLLFSIESFFEYNSKSLNLVHAPIPVPGGEEIKAGLNWVEKIWEDINANALCRHSFIIAIGGGAVLDSVGFASATAHRGIRFVRLPSTTLSQGDGGVGVKNAVNFFSKKNWVGTFTVPDAVVNDFNLLHTLPDVEKRAGFIEAVKVALIRDHSFFEYIEENMFALRHFEKGVLEEVIRRSAALHLQHIATSGDPFEKGSARPLDFGHWIAHKLETVSNFEIGHGEAVAIGIIADLLYSVRVGLLTQKTADRIIALIKGLGFVGYTEFLNQRSQSGEFIILEGLEEFREHLGGQLTITLIQGIGQGLEVNNMDRNLVLDVLGEMKENHRVAS